MTSQNARNYDDIINLPHPVSKNHPPMDLLDRAAQFSPFAALTGHDAAIKETARLTDKRVELDENSREILDEKMQMIKAHLAEMPEVSFTFFEPDERKDGGAYVTVTGRVKKIEEYEQRVVLLDGTVIPIMQIIDIYSEIIKM